MALSVVQSRIKACRFDYEYMGRSCEDLAKVYDFPLDAIEASAEAEGWERRVDISTAVLPDATNLEEFSQALLEITTARLSIVSVMRQIDNLPMMMALEQTLMDKLSEVAINIDACDVNAPKALASVVTTLNQIKDRSPVVLSKALAKDGEGQGNIKVVIQNQIN